MQKQQQMQRLISDFFTTLQDALPELELGLRSPVEFCRAAACGSLQFDT